MHSVGVIAYKLGFSTGYLAPALVIIGPVESFRTISSDTGLTFNGTFPSDWRNTSKWSHNVTKQATSEVSDQITLLFTTFAGVCVLLFILILTVVRDAPINPPSRACRRQTEVVQKRR